MRFIASRGIDVARAESKGGLPPDDCVEDEDAILADSERVIARVSRSLAPGAMTQIVLAPCSPFSVTDGLMREHRGAGPRARRPAAHASLRDARRGALHAASTTAMRPVDWMETLGWLGDDVWFAHAVHVDDDEIGAFARCGSGVCHCPTLEHAARLGHRAGASSTCAAGVKVGLGVDGSASNDGSNMLAEARQAMLLARLRLAAAANGGRSMDGRAEALEIATRGGAGVLGRDDIGALEPGHCADFFTLDLDTIGYAGALADPVGATLFCAPASGAAHGRAWPHRRARRARGDGRDGRGGRRA